MSNEVTFVFADLAGYTALTEAHGDEHAASTAVRFHDLARQMMSPATRLVKTIGDAVMLAAPTSEDAIATSLAILAAVNAERMFAALRVGIHRGPAVLRDGDYFGAAVNIAARVAGIARGGEVVCTEPIASIATTRSLAAARALGTFRLKNVSAPLALYALVVEQPEAELRHVDPVCRMLVGTAEVRAIRDRGGTLLYFCSQHCAETFDTAADEYLPIADV